MDPVKLLRACVSESGGDLEVAVEAADCMLTAMEVADNMSLSMNGGARGKLWINEWGIAVNGEGAALSLAGNEHRTETWVDQHGISHTVSVALSNEEQRQRDRERDERRRHDRRQQLSTLAVLDAALGAMSAREVALSILP